MKESRFNSSLKQFVFYLLLGGAIFLLSLTRARAQDLPATEEILGKMQIANDYFMAKWPDPGADIVTDRARPSNIWTRSVYYEGLLALYSIEQDQKYYNYAVQWGTSHDWAPAYRNLRTTNADDQCCGQAYIELYQIDPKPERIQYIKTTIDRMVNNNSNDFWNWVDAIQMAMPVFAKLGAAYQNNDYFEKMYDLYYFTKTSHGTNGLYNPEDHLWWRDGDFDPPYTEPNGEDCYWSRGNGWVLCALARVLDVLPQDNNHREEYVNTFIEMSEALVPIQRKDGFWNVSLHDSMNYGGPETSGTAFFTYGIAWGINNGLLDEEQYKPVVAKAWNGMVNGALHPDGFLGYVQGTGKEPSSSQPVTYESVPNFEDYGLGAFLLAGVEVYKLKMKETTSIEQGERNSESLFPVAIELLTVYPNPFNPSTQITYQLSKESTVNLDVFDLLGNKIYTFSQNLKQPAGFYRNMWYGTDDSGRILPTGIFFIRLQADNQTYIKKVTLLR